MNFVFVIKILCIGGLLKEYHMLGDMIHSRQQAMRESC